MRLLFSKCIAYKNEIYGFMNTSKIPFKINPSTMQLSWIPLGDGYRNTMTDIYDIYQKEQYAYILELDGKYLIRYDLEKNQYKYVEINYDGKTWDNFMLITERNDIIYIFPKTLKYLILYDTKKDVVSYEKMDNPDLLNRIWTCAVQYGNKVYLFEANSSCIWEYDFLSKQVQCIDVHEELGSVVYVKCYQGNIYILNVDGDVYKWKIQQESIVMIRESCNHVENEWAIIIPTDKNVWLLPAFGNEIVCIRNENWEETIFPINEDDYIYEDMRRWSKFYGYCMVGDDIYFAMRSSKYMFTIDKVNSNGKWVNVEISSTKGLFDCIEKNPSIGKLEESITLTDYIGYVCRSEENKHDTRLNNIGKTLYNL